MKKSILTFYILLFTPIILLAQPDWQWGQEVRVNAKHIAVDNFGNSYVTWSLQNSYTIDGEVFISNGPSDAALTSFDCDGTHRWTKIIGGQSGDVAWGLGTDTLGGVYLLCNVNDGRLTNYSLDIDSDTTITSNRKAMLLVKYNTEGDFQWLHMPEDTVIINLNDLQLAGGRDLEVAPNGDCYVYSKLPTGTYSNGAFEATFPGTVNDGEDIYILQYNGDGDFAGGVHLDMYYSGGTLVSSDLIRDHYTGRFYMSGYISNDNNIAIFGGEQVTAENYVVQFDSSGFVNWRISMDDIGIYASKFVGKPSVDEFGNIYVTGNSYNNNSFGGFTFYNTIDNYNFPIFAKIDSLGNVIYATNASVPGTSKGTATAYSNNQVGVTGNYASEIYWGDFEIEDPEGDQLSNAFLSFFEPSGNGLPTSINVLHSSPGGNETTSILTADRQGNFYVGGQFSGQLEVGDGTLYNQTGPNEGFIAKFGSDSCFCPLPEALFTYDSIPNEAEYEFVYTGSADVDSVIWDFGDGQVGYGINLEHIFAESGTYTVCATAYNQCGAGSVCITFEAQGPVGVRTIKGFEAVRVYPNPARDLIYIDHSLTNAGVEVLNAVGQEVLGASLATGLGQIDVSALPPGIYLLQIIDGDGKRGYARFVKQ